MIKAGHEFYMVKMSRAKELMNEASLMRWIREHTDFKKEMPKHWTAGYIAGLEDALRILTGEEPLLLGEDANGSSKKISI